MRAPSGDWSESDELSAEFEGFRSYDLDASPASGIFATWTWEIPSGDQENGIQAAVRPPGSDWSTPEEISSEGENSGLPDLGFDAAGNAIAIWGREEAAGEYFLQGSGYDFSGPQLNGLQIPATGEVGERLNFAVSPFDVFSLGTTSWTFGDGGQAGGNAVSHAYGARGTYPVTVSAVDASGNASTQTRALTITGPPPSPPPPIKLELRVKTRSLGRLLRSGKLVVLAKVNKPARVALKGRAKIRVHRRRGSRIKVIDIFKKEVLQFPDAGWRKVELELSSRGETMLRRLTRVKILITGKATDATGARDRDKVVRTFQRGKRPRAPRAR
jgi:hypothetical protein